MTPLPHTAIFINCDRMVQMSTEIRIQSLLKSAQTEVVLNIVLFAVFNYMYFSKNAATHAIVGPYNFYLSRVQRAKKKTNKQKNRHI